MNLDYINNLSTLHQIILGGFTVTLFIQICYYLIVYLRPSIWKRKTTNTKQNPISVIICAKNESENLKTFLPKILEQDYTDFEVIVVNDCSSDDSEVTLAILEQTYKNLRHTNIKLDNTFNHGKKLAINIGIKSSKHEQLVFTDADCYPNTNQWLKEINKAYTTNKQIIIGYGGYQNQPGFLNKLIRYDTIFIAMQYFGLSLLGRPYMGIGRNLSYLKGLYTNGNGFKSHYGLISGDDDLFVNEHANKINTTPIISSNSSTTSIPNSKFSYWANQKKRHLTTAHRYKFMDKFILGIEIISRFLFYLGLITLLLLKFNIVLIVSAYLLRLFLQLTTIKILMNKLNEKKFLLLVPLFDLILPICQLFFLFSNKINSKRNKNKWI